MARRVDKQNLIAANSKLSVRKRASTLGGHFYRLANAIEHDKIVARTVHFCKVPSHADIISNLQAIACKLLFDCVNKAWPAQLGVF
jgi:hypothetical protein